MINGPIVVSMKEAVAITWHQAARRVHALLCLMLAYRAGIRHMAK